MLLAHFCPIPFHRAKRAVRFGRTNQHQSGLSFQRDTVGDTNQRPGDVEMVGEAEIQAFLEEVIGHGQLYQAIGGKDEIERASSAHNSPEFIPNFNLDYLLRIRSVTSAT